MPSADQSRRASSSRLVGLADPDRAAAARQPVVEQDAGDLPPLPRAGAIAEKPATAKSDGILEASSRAAATTSKVASTVQEPARKSECPSPA